MELLKNMRESWGKKIEKKQKERQEIDQKIEMDYFNRRVHCAKSMVNSTIYVRQASTGIIFGVYHLPGYEGYAIFPIPKDMEHLVSQFVME